MDYESYTNNNNYTLDKYLQLLTVCGGLSPAKIGQVGRETKKAYMVDQDHRSSTLSPFSVPLQIYPVSISTFADNPPL